MISLLQWASPARAARRIKTFWRMKRITRSASRTHSMRSVSRAPEWSGRTISRYRACKLIVVLHHAKRSISSRLIYLYIYMLPPSSFFRMVIIALNQSAITRGGDSYRQMITSLIIRSELPLMKPMLRAGSDNTSVSRTFFRIRDSDRPCRPLRGRC